MFCMNCGAEIDGDAAYCEKCGVPTGASAHDGEPSVPTATASVTAASGGLPLNKKDRTAAVRKLSMAAFIIICVAWACVFIMSFTVGTSLSLEFYSFMLFVFVTPTVILLIVAIVDSFGCPKCPDISFIVGAPVLLIYLIIYAFVVMPSF